MKLRFSEIEAVLQQVHGIPVDAQTQFRAKLRNLFRVGLALPSGSAGRKANFHPADMFKMAFTVELLQAGIAPEPAALTVAQHWPDMVEQIFAVRSSLQAGKPIALYLVAEPHAVTSRYYYRFKPETGESLAARLAAPAGSFAIARLLVINAGAMLKSVMDAAAKTDIDMELLGASLDADQAIILEKGAGVLVRPKSGFVETAECE